MNTTYSKFTEAEIIEIGRAMERYGFTDIGEFMCWAAREKAKAILAEK